MIVDVIFVTNVVMFNARIGKNQWVDEIIEL